MIEIWRAGGTEVAASTEPARRVEAEGWDGQMFMDSACLSADPWVTMGAWAAATERLRLCTGVTNTLTRHPAVTAACAATVQSLSGGRAVLGIGRGDSALAHLGHAPDSLAHFERTLQELQALLQGEEVAFSRHQRLETADNLEALSLGERPTASRLHWLPAGLPKVPLDVAATGPRVIAMAAALAERVTFSVGAAPERLVWALDIARQARAERKLEGDCSYGAQVIVVCHPDTEAVREAATSFVAPLARFQVIQGDAAGPQTDLDRENFAAVRAGYNMTRHGDRIADKVKGANLHWDFVRRFAIVGPPEHCLERLLALHRLGIERFVIVGPGYHPEVDASGPGLFVREVMPALRAAARAGH